MTLGRDMRDVLKLMTPAVLLAIGPSQQVHAGLAVTGTVTGGGVVPIVQPATVPTTALLKVKLEVPSDSILLCLGSFSEIFATPPQCGQQLGDPVGPGGPCGATGDLVVKRDPALRPLPLRLQLAWVPINELHAHPGMNSVRSPPRTSGRRLARGGSGRSTG
jgi:hypothetical protein